MTSVRLSENGLEKFIELILENMNTIIFWDIFLKKINHEMPKLSVLIIPIKELVPIGTLKQSFYF